MTGHAPAPLLFLRERFAWMGEHSGYDLLFERLADEWPGEVESVYRTRSALQNGLYAPLELLTRPRTPFYNGDSLAAERRALRRAREIPAALIHVAYVENNLRLFARRRPGEAPRVIGTAHQPPEWWRHAHRHPELASSLDALIAMGARQAEYFEEHMPGRVHFIRHGVDPDYITPAPPDAPAHAGPEQPRCVFGGVWMRDLATLRAAASELLGRRPQLQLDLIVPLDRRGSSELEQLAGDARVHLHADLDDQGLRAVYRGARLLLLPLVDATANNTLLEAVACGLPVVTNAVGGVSDYTRQTFAAQLPVGDVEGMVAAALRLIDDADEAQERGAFARAFARRELSWADAARATSALHRALVS